VQERYKQTSVPDAARCAIPTAKPVVPIDPELLLRILLTLSDLNVLKTSVFAIFFWL
jgi:hypothetical protein